MGALSVTGVAEREGVGRRGWEAGKRGLMKLLLPLLLLPLLLLLLWHFNAEKGSSRRGRMTWRGGWGGE